jgi:hypothetical protein
MTIKVTYNVTDVYVTQDVSPVYINVSYSGGGSGGAAVWGGITGTLSNQTDLQTALDGKFDDPTGTTSQYLRGDGSLATFPAIPSGTVTSVGLTMPSAFSVANSPVTSSGTLAVTGAGDTTQYIAGDGSLVAFPITGQAGTLVREVRNVTGATLTKGTVVYINGASGNKPTVAKAIATSDATSAQTFGLIQADIPNNSNGYLVAFGDLDGLNTSAFAEGVQLYLSATTSGGYTSTKQYAPNHLVYIGVVTRQHVNQGRIEVRIQNGYEMDELHDVAAQTPSNNDGLFYNSTNSLWENKSIATALGYTPANAATTLTINGVTYDLSTSRTFTVGSVTGSGASGQVSYWDGTSSQAGSNNLFWDNANGRLGIGLNNPADTLHLNSGGVRIQNIRASLDNFYTAGVVNGLKIQNTTTNGRTLLGLVPNGTSALADFWVFNTSDTTTNYSALAWGYELNSTFWGINSISAGTGQTRPIYINATNGQAVASSNISFFTNGNVGIGTGSTNGGQRLQVQGTTLLNGNVTFSSATGMFWDATNSRLGIGTNAPQGPLHINTDITLANNGFTITRTGISLADANFQITNGTNTAGQFLPTFISTSNIAGVGGFFSGRFTPSSTSDIGLVLESRTKAGAALSQGYIASFRSLATDYVRIAHNGNMLLQNGGTFTDSGERLQVTGNVKIVGSGATSATTALTVQNSSSSNLFTIRNDGISKFGSSTYFDVSSPLIVGTDGAAGARISIANNSNFQDFQMINTSIGSGNINTWSFGVRRDTFFGNTIGSFQFVGSYTNNSGSGSTVGGGYRVPMIFNPNGDVLILGGNANVVNGLIGLKVNAPTAHVDITASTTSNASLRIRSGTAPTSPNDGDIWFDGTDIKMRIGGVTKTFTLL